MLHALRITCAHLSCVAVRRRAGASRKFEALRSIGGLRRVSAVKRDDKVVGRGKDVACQLSGLAEAGSPPTARDIWQRFSDPVPSLVGCGL